MKINLAFIPLIMCSCSINSINSLKDKETQSFSYSYPQHESVKMIDNVTNAERIGTVQSTCRLHYSFDCLRCIEDVLLQDEAKRIGGNVISDVKWYVKGVESETPACTFSFFFYYWSVSAEAQANVYRTN